MNKGKWDIYTNEDLLEMLKSFYIKNNRSPKKKDFGAINDLPSTTLFYKRFNTSSLNYILNLSGLPINHNQILTRDINKTNYRVEKSIIELKELANALKRCPYVSEYNNYIKEGYVQSTLSKILNKKYAEICKAYIPEYRVNKDYDFTKEIVLDKIFKIKEITGHIPMYKELKEHGLGNANKLFMNLFGKSYREVVEELGWGELRYKILNKSKEEMLNDFYRLYTELGRIPYLYEIDNCDYTTWSINYKSVFGSILNVCNLLDINYEENYENRISGMILYDNNGSLCRSIIEKDISNFLIINNIKFEKEISYEELILSEFKKTYKRRFDWKIDYNNNIFYIEYFGIWNNQRNSDNDFTQNYMNKAKRKIRDIVKNNYFDKCIFIFPRDIYKKNIKNIFENKLHTKLIDVDYTEKKNTTTKFSLSDQELLNHIMKYSDNPNSLPTYSKLRNNQQLSYYVEIIKRYGNLNNFAEIMNKTLDIKKKKGYWTKEELFNKFKYMIDFYGKILDRSEILNTEDINIKGMNAGIVKFGGNLLNLKLEYFISCLNNNCNIPQYELDRLQTFINNEINSSKIEIRERIKRQQDLSIFILNNIIK